AMTLAALNLLAFAWHTVLELLEPPWQASRSGGQANQLLRPHPHVERLRNLSLLAGFPQIPRHLLDPARPHKSRRQSVNVVKVPTFRIAGSGLADFPRTGLREQPPPR